VETREQLDLLARYGCDEVQGFIFCEPTTAEECSKIMREGRPLSWPHPGRRAAEVE
jgi:EAL domain-containing protein (putative c-di-GMP-specific phosphodiesterase class I)